MDDQRLLGWACGTTGATTPSAISHRTPATPPTSRPVERSASSDHGPGLPRGRHRGDPRRGPQPHRRKLTTSGRRSASAASTTPPITGCWTPDLRLCKDFTGTKQQPQRPATRTPCLIMDSLRYWAQEMHVDGFRFDLASTLAQEVLGVDRLSASSTWFQPGSVISQLEADRRALGHRRGGYQVDNFPVCGPGWNRQVPRHRPRLLARQNRPPWESSPPRLTSSSDLYEATGRRPIASINFVTCPTVSPGRPGFPATKTTEANGGTTRDGEATTDPGTAGSRAHRGSGSWNCGIGRCAKHHNDPDAVPGPDDQPRRQRSVHPAG